MNSQALSAVVTGASRGIGAAIAIRLARTGLPVAVGFQSRASAAERVVKTIEENGGRGLAVSMDIADRTSVKNAMAMVRNHLGPIGVLVNNAAIAQEKPFLTITDDDLQTMLSTNLGGPFVCTQEVLPLMLEQGWGRIVNITSIGGQWGGMNQIHYASAKAGLIGLTKSIAKTFSRQGITCNAVSPGLVATEMSGAELNTPAGQDKARQIPVGRLGTAEEVAEAVAFLVSSGGAYMTGQTLNVNGGMYFG